MEQLAPFIEGCKKHKFWIACGICAAAMLGVFVYSSMNVNKEKKEQISLLDQKLQAVESINGVNFAADQGNDANGHPNAETNKQTKARIQDGKDAAWKAWNQQYDRQKDLLTWPVEALGADGVREFESQLEQERWNVKGKSASATPRGQRPKPSTNSKEEVEAGHGNVEEKTRIAYQRFIKEEMPVVAKIIGATWKFDDSLKIQINNSGKGRDRGRAEGPGMSQAAGMTGVGGNNQNDPSASIEYNKDTVIWDESNQDYWNRLVTEYEGRNGNPEKYPTTAQVMTTQQDLWILKALFNVVKEVNGEVKENDLVNIQKIDHVFTGLAAISTTAKVMRIEASEEAPGGTRGRGGFDNVAGGRETRGRRNNATANSGSKSKFKPEASVDPIHGRYVNTNFEPMAEADIRKAATTEKLDAEPEYSVAKRIPFRLGVVMDEREIDKFLAACANSPFAIEVRQIRINRHTPNEFDTSMFEGQGGGGRDMGAGDRGKGGEGGTVSSAGLGSQSASGGGAGAASGTMTGIDRGRGAGAMGNRDRSAPTEGGTIATRTDYKIKVEFSGIVKIFYKPRPKLLNQNTDDDNANKTNPAVASR